MTRYFFDIIDGMDVIDGEGTELSSLDEAKKEAARLAAGLLRDDPERFWKGIEWTVRVSDERRLTLFEITFLANLAPSVTGVMADT